MLEQGEVILNQQQQASWWFKVLNHLVFQDLMLVV
jgi:hypothetical protein